MKKIFKTGFTFALALSLLTACSEDDKVSNTSEIATSALPMQARSFVSDYFSAYNYNTVLKNQVPDEKGSIYTAQMTKGLEIDFNHQGEWVEIEGNGMALPPKVLELLPSSIVKYVLTEHSKTAIEEIEKKKYGYKVKLLNGNKILFDKKGEILEDKNKIDVSVLPQSIKNFIESNFSNEKYSRIEVDKNDNPSKTEYKIYLSDKYKLEFNGQGQWTKIETDNSILPKSILKSLPNSIQEVLPSKYPNTILESIEFDIENGIYEFEDINGNDFEISINGDLEGENDEDIDDDQNIDEDESDDNDKIISQNELPQSIKGFVNTHFANSSYLYIVKKEVASLYDGRQYEVFLSNGYKLSFDKDGNWLSVISTTKLSSLPISFINSLPSNLKTYIQNNYPQADIQKVIKKALGYIVTLKNAPTLKFNQNGNYIGFN